MNIIKNIPGAVKFYAALPKLNRFKRNIEKAKEEGDVETEKENIRLATSYWGKGALKTFGIKLRVTGYENLPDKGPVVYVSNHQGYGDIFTYCAVLDKIQFAFVAKDDLAKIPLYGTWIRRIRSVMIERDDPRESLKAIKTGINYLDQGFSLLIFPEGTRSKGHSIGEFKKGALKLATKPGVPVVPLTLDGTYEMFEEKGYLQRSTVDVVIHPPIKTQDMSKHEESQLGDKLEELIRNTLKNMPRDGKEFSLEQPDNKV